MAARNISGGTPMFNGENDDYDKFINQFGYEAVMFNWDETAQARAIKHCLSGKALRYYNELDDTKKADIKEVMKKLKECSARAPEYYLNLFYARKLRTNESIAAFCHDIQFTLEKAMPGINESTKFQLLKARLISVVPENVKSFLELLADKRWDEIVAIFDKSTDYKVIVPSEFNHEIEVNRTEVTNKRVVWVDERDRQQQRIRTPNEQRAKHFDGKCFHCNGYGHRRSQCQALTAELRQARQPNRENRTRPYDNRFQAQSGQHRQLRDIPTSRPQQSFQRTQEASRPFVSRDNQSRQSTQTRQSNFTQRNVNAFNIDADYDDDDEFLVVHADEADCMTIECENYTCSAIPERLVRVEADTEINRETTKIPMLIDCGATTSFINPNRMPDRINKVINDFISSGKTPKHMDLRRVRLTMKSALISKNVECAVGRVNFKIGGWHGEHEFIFADVAETAILGLDFWRKNEAKLDFETNEISIRDQRGRHTIWKAEEMKTITTSVVAASLTKEVTLAPNSEQLIRIRVPSDFKPSESIMFEPKACSELELKRGMMWASSISVVDNQNETLVSVINVSDSEITLLNETEIGTIKSSEMFSVETESRSSTPKHKPKWDTIEINPKLSELNKTHLSNLLGEFEQIFQWSEFDMGLTSLTEHTIETGDARPIKQQQYRLPQAAKNEVDRQIETMLENRVIEESRSPWASPIILVKKKSDDGKQSFRFCVDFRKLNAVTVKDSYPLPRIDDTIDALGGARFFSTLDLASGYWQIPVTERDREKTAFCANSKLYQFTVMPFGLCNAPSTFQRLMDGILRNLTWTHCLVYLDDIIVFSRDFKTHMERLRVILERLKAANLKLKPSKCKFAMSKVNYLGFQISEDGLQPDANKTRTIAEMSAPTSREEVKRFLGMMSYYRRFIRDFGTTASCLFDLTKVSNEFKWSKSCDEAFIKLKNQLVNAPILIYPDFKREFEIFSDASGVAIGAVLVQRIGEVHHPIAYASRQLSKAEKNYSTSEREMLAIVWAARHFNAYIYGRHVTFHTDHKPLTTLERAKEPNGRLYRLYLKLQEFDFKIVYCPGPLNYTADLLSRNTNEAKTSEVKAIELKLDIDWSFEQSRDRELAIIKMRLKSNEQDDEETSSRDDEAIWRRNWPYLRVKDDVIYLKNHENNEVVVVPSHMRTKVCSLYHDSITAGHMAFERTYKAIAARFYWPRMRTTVFDYCASCDVCQRHKPKNQTNTQPLVSIRVGQPWDMIGIDFAGPLKVTPKLNKYFIIAIDYCSKFVIARATSDATAETTISFVRDEIITKFGAPISILSDQGRNFEAAAFEAFCTSNGIKKVRTSPYHPQGNGLVERSIRTIKQALSTIVNESHNDWDIKLGASVLAYNNTVQSSTGYAPNQMVFGRLLPTPEDRKLNVQPPVNDKTRDEMVDQASERIAKAQQQQKKQYDTAIHPVEFKSGEKVLVHNTQQRVGQVRSFEPKYKGPFEIIRKTNSTNYELLSDNGATKNVHANRMVRYTTRATEDNRVGQRKPSWNDANEEWVTTTLDAVIASARDRALIARIQANNKPDDGDDNSRDDQAGADGKRDGNIDDIVGKVIGNAIQQFQVQNENEFEGITDLLNTASIITGGGVDLDETNEDGSTKTDDNLMTSDDEKSETANKDEEKEFKCTVEGCKFSSHTKSGLKTHKTRMHKKKADKAEKNATKAKV